MLRHAKQGPYNHSYRDNMLKTFKFAVGAALVAASQLAAADVAEVKVSVVPLSVAGGWYYMPVEV